MTTEELDALDALANTPELASMDGVLRVLRALPRLLAEAREAATIRAKLAESEERRVRARQEADAALARERKNSDILLKVAGAFNGWANGKRAVRGARGAVDALEQIGEALGNPFAPFPEEAKR